MENVQITDINFVPSGKWCGMTCEMNLERLAVSLFLFCFASQDYFPFGNQNQIQRTDSATNCGSMSYVCGRLTFCVHRFVVIAMSVLLLRLLLSCNPNFPFFRRHSQNFFLNQMWHFGIILLSQSLWFVLLSLYFSLWSSFWKSQPRYYMQRIFDSITMPFLFMYNFVNFISIRLSLVMDQKYYCVIL